MNTHMILVVDDQHQFRQATRECLLRKGYEVACALDGDHALKKIQQGSIAAVLLEATVAGTSGLEVLRRIRRVAPQLPVLVVTEHPSPEAERAFMSLGAHAYLPKAVPSETIADAVEDAVEFVTGGR